MSQFLTSPRVTGKHVDQLRGTDSPYISPLTSDKLRSAAIYTERLDYLDAFAEAQADLKRRQDLALLIDIYTLDEAV